MANIEFKRSGTQRLHAIKLPPKRLLAMLTICATLLTACETTQTTATGNACLGWRKITFAYPGDQTLTIKQVRRHNAYGHQRGCW